MSAKRREISQLPTDIRGLINDATRAAAVNIMNDLAEAGPEWSGEFQDSWIAVPVGRGASGSTGGGYPYTLSDVPRLSISIKETARVKKFEIVNTQPYAEYALDLKKVSLKVLEIQQVMLLRLALALLLDVVAMSLGTETLEAQHLWTGIPPI